ncbi:hypothetical protein MTO96_021314 [Rhipicephalus appendiculatus]
MRRVYRKENTANCAKPEKPRWRIPSEAAMLAASGPNTLPPTPPRSLRREDYTADLYPSDDEDIVATEGETPPHPQQT